MNPSLSVVVAVYNGANFLPSCLSAIREAIDAETEIILVNDGSTDNSAEIGKQFGTKVINLKQCTGAANARNVGARKAQGEIILFVDADVVIQRDTIKHLRQIFAENPEYSAVFGSYDTAPGEPDFFSQYRNLMHHFFHQIGCPEAETFWSGLGAMKREAFLHVGGFDAHKYKTPSVEDIELGYRLREKGCRILLVPELQVKHLKKWTFRSIIKTDFWYRAVPWVEIMFYYPNVRHDLNVKTSQKISALFAGIFLLSIGLVLFKWWSLFVGLFSLISLFAINKDFYAFFLRQRGFWFTFFVFPMNLLYFNYSSLAFVYSWCNVKIIQRISRSLKENLSFFFFKKRIVQCEPDVDSISFNKVLCTCSLYQEPNIILANEIGDLQIIEPLVSRVETEPPILHALNTLEVSEDKARAADLTR
jgi:glycosyltransferase involved in cell wall biosynthesis